MARTKPQPLSVQVIEFYESRRQKKCPHRESQRATVLHFKEAGKRRTSVQRIIKKFIETGIRQHVKPPGRPATQSSLRNVNRVIELIRINPTISVMETVDTLNITKKGVQLCRKKAGIKSWQVKKAGLGDQEQKIRAQVNCRVMSTLFQQFKLIIIDDESYVPLNPKLIPGQGFVSAQSKEKMLRLPDDVLFQTKKRLYARDQFMVWQALSEDGTACDPYIMTGTMNGEIYTNQCLKKRLIPWIESKGVKFEEVLFWPDMSRVHYKKCAQDYLKSIGIRCISWRENAPSVPHARPVEKYWALMKRGLKKRFKNSVKTVRSFKRRWVKLSRDLLTKSGRNLMSGIRDKVRMISNHGVTGPLRK